MFGVFAHGGADEGGQFGGNAFRRPVARERVHHAFGRQRAFGKTRPLQIFGGAALHGFKHGVAEQVVAAFFSVHHQIVGIEMKAHMRRKIRQPKHRSLQACGLPRCNRFVQRRLPRMFVGEFADIEFQAERFAGVFDDAARRNAVRHQRHTGELDQRHIHKSQPAGEPENQRFVERVAVVVQQGGHHAAFAMGGVLVGEIVHDIG